MFHIQRQAGLAVRVKVSRAEQMVSRGGLTLLTDGTDLREQDFLPAGIEEFHLWLGFGYGFRFTGFDAFSLPMLSREVFHFLFKVADAPANCLDAREVWILAHLGDEEGAFLDADGFGQHLNLVLIFLCGSHIIL